MSEIQRFGRDKMLQLLAFALTLALGFQVACAQRNLKAIADNDEISLRFEHMARSGDTKKYLIDLRDIPNAPPLPTGYKLLDSKSYYLKTQAIDLGDPIVSFRIQAKSEEDFRKARVLRLRASEMTPRGYEWRDCTISLDNVWQTPSYSKEHYGEYLRDDSQRKVACHIRDEPLKPDEYLAVVLQGRPPPTKPFTHLTYTVEPNGGRASTDDVSYKITFENTGQKDIGELNILSSFNANVTTMKTERGTCRRSDWGFYGGSTACYRIACKWQSDGTV